MNQQGGKGVFEAKSPPPSQQQPLQCPRCESIDTKFGYYNNKSASQPRYFCKSCRRHWTQGGTPRYVPIGGGSRKRKRSSTKNNPSSFFPKQLQSISDFPKEQLDSPSMTKEPDLAFKPDSFLATDFGQLFNEFSNLDEGIPFCGLDDALVNLDFDFNKDFAWMD
ncbi:hypothetical protein GIB67_028276 [Kingdonia uniflora]|uniref:Dof zinc finger protein n=1 Tax=Kingdonia uniflora TaxID=39325 RepID=A0A7J7KZA4_9MAGN|nr:hypothetical protein GIB67_028276 [Kingdonia uniflora]